MNKKIYLLLPFCLTLLPACTSSYTLTLINSDSECGTIITEGGKYKAGEQVNIEVEPTQGYKVDKWIDSVSGKVGSRSTFTFEMPNRDTELTVYYKYADFELSYDYNITAEDNRFDFENVEEIVPSFSILEFNTNDTFHINFDKSDKFTWKDTVAITDVRSIFATSATDLFAVNSITDENGNMLGESSCSFEMPNHDTKTTFNLESRGYGAYISCNIPYIGLNFNCYGYYWWSGEMVNSYFSCVRFCTDNCTSVSFIYDSYYEYDSSEVDGKKYVFDSWLDLETNQTVTTDTTLNINFLTDSHHYQCVLREA